MAKKNEELNEELLGATEVVNTGIDTDLDESLFDLGIDEEQEFQDFEFRSFDIEGLFSSYTVKTNLDGSRGIQLKAKGYDEDGAPATFTIKLNNDSYNGANLLNKKLSFIGGKELVITDDNGKTNIYYNATDVKIVREREKDEVEYLKCTPYADLPIEEILITQIKTGSYNKKTKKPIMEDACFIRSVKKEDTMELALNIQIKMFNARVIQENNKAFVNKTVRVYNLRKNFNGKWTADRLLKAGK